MTLLLPAAPLLLGQPLSFDDAASIGLPAGAVAPAFELADQTGKSQTLSSLAGPKGLVLVFFRSADWCIYCKAQLVQLQQEQQAVRDAGYGIAAVSYDSAAVLADFAKRKQITVPLLADHDSTVINAFQVRNGEYQRGMQIDVEREILYRNSFDNTPVYGMAYPAIFILDPSGKVSWRFVSTRAELRFTASAVLARSGQALVRHPSQSIQEPNARIISSTSNLSSGLANRLYLSVDIDLPPGLHIYGPEVGGTYRGLIWSMATNACLAVKEALYPDALPIKFDFEERALPVYEGKVRLSREVIVPPAISARNPDVYRDFLADCVPNGKLTASATLQWQACDLNRCYPPTRTELRWEWQFIPPDRQRVPTALRREFE